MKKIRSAFEDVGFSKSESAALMFKSEIYSKIISVIKARKLTRIQLEKLLEVPQPRVSELLNQKISGVSIEKLLIYLDKLGITASISFRTPKAG
jgi:predicted XRE-type DNA-binding protein